MRYALLPLLLLVASCAIGPEKEKDAAIFTETSFSDLDNWENDRHSEALDAFRRSCAVIRKKQGWGNACAKAQETASDDDSARAFFETEFRVYALSGPDGDIGLFTGYYVPELTGSKQQEGNFQTPLYARPTDLVTADLGLFKTELEGQKVVGKVMNNKFMPYDERAEIADGALNARATPLCWVNDPVDAFFLEIQGSGKVRLPDGTTIYVGYDGTNGRAYKAIGRVLADRNELPRPVTMPAIRAKLASTERAQEIMNWNPSYVFFRILPQQEAIGAQGIGLTPTRSLAVDPKHIRLGTPLWIETTNGKDQPLQRLMVAQDTGGAIKGVVRGDFFWGEGDEAAEQAGAMQSQGRAYVLLPKDLSPDAN
jgi:membrane-bound lytic murein transglycosylase A